MEQKQDEEIVAGALRVLALILGEHAVQVPTGDTQKKFKTENNTKKPHVYIYIYIFIYMRTHIYVGLCRARQPLASVTKRISGRPRGGTCESEA
jgi:hypothetical protein